MTSPSNGDADATRLLTESACHEAGHVLLCLTLPGADLAFARAATSGTGTSRLQNAKELDPRDAAKVAVAGRVSEEVLLGLERRPVPENDGYLLTWAMEELGGSVTEDDVRDEVAALMRDAAPTLQHLADVLAASPDVDVDVEQLRVAFAERA